VSVARPFGAAFGHGSASLFSKFFFIHSELQMDQPHHLTSLCLQVQGSFGRLASFAQEHDLSFSLTAFFVLVGSLNIRPHSSGMIFEPVSPAVIAKAAQMEPKTVSRWCSQLTEAGLMRRHRAAYAVEPIADWYALASCFGMQAPAVTVMPPALHTPVFEDLVEPPVQPIFDSECLNQFA
jgi:hypothetical protein